MTNLYDDEGKPLVRRSDLVGLSRGVMILLLIISPIIVGLLIMFVVNYMNNMEVVNTSHFNFILQQSIGEL